MRFAVNLATCEVHVIPEHQRFEQIPGVQHNGKHCQLNGYVLSEYRISGGQLCLWHPNTSARSGHVDVFYCPTRRDGQPGVEICDYHHTELDLADEQDLLLRWPSGPWSLLSAIIAIERKMAETEGYRPKLERWLGQQFRQTKPTKKFAAVAV